ncbi:hypothetical protein VTN31DRAFT_4950 [Thermomyces dupontii]|uniref:uncharacterized protein n=1 Tax=Talaromyces thermophilus TaxID=28565 RepID=UPI0037421E04
MPVFSSPFPTTHDTVGASILDTRQGQSSSPTRSSTRQADNGHETVDQNKQSGDDAESGQGDSNSASRRNTAVTSDLDKRLAQYTVDWSRLPGGSKDDMMKELDMPDENDEDSEIGGPEDFTMNLDKYLLGGATRVQKGGEKSEEDEGQNDREGRADSHLSLARQRPDEAEYSKAEYSTFGPPVDMSTPSHLMWTKNAETGKEVTQLEEIEEHINSSSDAPGTPSKAEKQDHATEDDTYATVMREIEQLQQELRDKDEQLQENHKRVLEAASAAEEIRSLRAELHHKSALLAEAEAKRGEESLLREQLQMLQNENDDKDKLLQEIRAKASRVEALEQKVEDLKNELAERDETVRNDTAHQQLDELRMQLDLKDDELEEAESKLRNLKASMDLQLRQKDGEIDDLKAQLNDRELEIQGMEETIEDVKEECQSLEKRIESLESRNRSMEETNNSLQTETTQLKSELTSQRNALNSMAAELAVDVSGKSFGEVLESCKSILQSRRHTPQGETLKTEMDELKNRIAQLQNSLQEAATAKQSAEVEKRQAEELLKASHALITTIEDENTRLSTRLDDFSSILDAARLELARLNEHHETTLETLNNRLGSVSISVPATSDEAHRRGIDTLQSAHTKTTSALRDSYEATIDNLRSMLSNSEKRERQLREELHSAQAAHAVEISSLRDEITRLQTLVAIKEDAAADVDRQIARSIEKREREWEKRVEALLKEREKMGKALLYAWGEKEVGRKSTSASSTKDKKKGSSEDERQGYRYKYVVKEKW